MKQITDSLANEQVDVPALYRKVLLNRPAVTTVTTVAEGLVTPGARQLAYEMAVCVCDADDVCNPAEQEFLDQLRNALGLSTTQPADAEWAALATIPVASPAPALAEETGTMILRYAILGGALELLPQTMATLAILPLQTKMLYRIGQQRGNELDRKSIAEFLAQIYYDSSRTLSMQTLKAKYPPLLAEGKALAAKYTSQITAQGQQLQGVDLSTLLSRLE